MKRAIAFTACLSAAAVSMAPAAQAPAAEVAPATTSAPITMPPPVIDPASEITGKALVDALRSGGFVLYMRHAQQRATLGNDCTQPSLMPAGEEQARRVGAALRELKIPIGRVIASEICRAIETARLLDVGNVSSTADLNPLATTPGFDVEAARVRRLAEVPAKGTNTLLVSHSQSTGKREHWIHIALAEIVVYRPDGKGDAVPVARIRPERWSELAAAMAAAPQ